MMTDKTHDEWMALSTNYETATRALADWAADMLGFLRSVADEELADSAPRTLYWHVEQLFLVLARRAVGGPISTSPAWRRPDYWHEAYVNRAWLLRCLADELGHMQQIFTAMAGNEEALRWITSDSTGAPHWHAEQAHLAALTLLTGDTTDSRRLYTLWGDNRESTEHNQRILASER